ncbi:hypothetical protein RZS08_29245 [Arthrospira platensis SPKY1]|nr:hypothetical protein [Arthrospira platensis SPKY1]
MTLARVLIFLLLGGAAVCFAYYIFTGQERFKRLGLIILKWTIFAGLGFFGVLIVLNLIQ